MVDHLFRKQSGKMSAILTRIFGFHHSRVVEDIIQETFLTAMKTWSVKGPPEHPEAWLMTVARNKLINELNRIRRHAEKNELARLDKVEEQLDELFLDHEIRDSELRVLFACCEPILKPRVQIMLTLKVLSGFSDKEIAGALFMKPAAVKKSIFRAKEQIRNHHGESFGIPYPDEVKDRFDTALTIVYLLFNEGYKRTDNTEIISEELCLEACRLALLLLEFRETDPGNVHALLALMLFSMARFDARVDPEGAMIDLQHQDRSLWDRKLINKAMHHMKASRSSTQLSRYHLESSIAAIHTTAGSFEETNWKGIVQCYRQLLLLDDSDTVRLNYAIALGKLDGPEAGLRELEKLEEKPDLKKSLLYASKAAMYLNASQYEKAKSYYQVALDYADHEADRTFLRKKILECDRRNLSIN